MLLFWHIVDIFWSCLLIFPLTALYWSGTWKLLDLYLLPNNPDISSLVCTLVGSVVGVLGYAIFPLLKQRIRIACSFKHVAISRTFVYIFAFSNLMFWRGVWNLSFQYFLGSLLASAVYSVASIMFLMLFKCCGQTVGNPFFVSLDTGPEIYDSSTRYRLQVGN